MSQFLHSMPFVFILFHIFLCVVVVDGLAARNSSFSKHTKKKKTSVAIRTAAEPWPSIGPASSRYYIFTSSRFIFNLSRNYNRENLWTKQWRGDKSNTFYKSKRWRRSCGWAMGAGRMKWFSKSRTLIHIVATFGIILSFLVLYCHLIWLFLTFYVCFFLLSYHVPSSPHNLLHFRRYTRSFMFFFSPRLLFNS